tara:strand:- start:53061 stop:53621 length:561 start_codon:yes stop_codon:yes gene_type:complete
MSSLPVRDPLAAVVVGLGGNLGGPSMVAVRIAAAIESISEQWGPALVSSHYVSAPVGPVANQPDFLNAVAAWWPEQLPSPEEALALLQELEHEHGRERILVGGARTLDLDLLLHARQSRSSKGLQIPHPRMGERAFVLAPLRELFGDEFCWDVSLQTVTDRLCEPSVAEQECRRVGAGHVLAGADD